MSLKHPIPQGTSEPQDFTLKSKGAPFDGTGFTLALIIKRKVGATYETVSTPPTAAWLTAADGTVRVSGCENLTPGQYAVNFEVTDGSGKKGYFPNNNESDLWTVKAVPNLA